MNKVYHVSITKNNNACKYKKACNSVKSNIFNIYKNKYKELKSFDIDKFKKISETNTFLELHIGFGTSLFIKKILNTNKETIEYLLISNYVNDDRKIDKFTYNLKEDDIAKYLKS